MTAKEDMERLEKTLKELPLTAPAEVREELIKDLYTARLRAKREKPQ